MYPHLEESRAWTWLWNSPESGVVAEMRQLERKLYDPKINNPVMIAQIRNVLLGMRRVAEIVANGAAELKTDLTTATEIGPAPLHRKPPFLNGPIGG